MIKNETVDTLVEDLTSIMESLQALADQKFAEANEAFQRYHATSKAGERAARIAQGIRDLID